MARPKKVIETSNVSMSQVDNIIRCPMCGKGKTVKDFYRSNSPLYTNNQGVMAWCKECSINTYDTYYNILKDIKKSVLITCMKFDIPFSEGDYDGATKQFVNNQKSHIFKIYMTKINSLGAKNSGATGFDPKFLFFRDDNGKDIITNALESEVKTLEYNIQLSDEDLQIKEDVTRLIGYDPFDGYSNFDRKFLYNELISYLDEDTLDDSFKLSQILQLVNNNNQVRKIDLVIATLSNDAKTLISNQGEIKSLTTTKKSIVESTDKIAKENSISVKNRGDKKAGKSTLTYMMKDYRELGFEDAEVDYYDQLKAVGMKHAADISNKSILEQLRFDENDLDNLIKDQRVLIQDLQNQVDTLLEENRQLRIESKLDSDNL